MAVLAVLGALLALGATGLPVPAAPGWRPVFQDDFDGSVLRRPWGAYGGPHGMPAASHYRPDEVVVSGGLLRLRMQKREYGGRAYTTGGVGSWQLVQTYGRYEFSAKAPLGAGIDAYATLWPADEAGADGNATLIEVLAKPGDEKAYLTNLYGSGDTGEVVRGRYSDTFHTYTVEWSPQQLRILIDGVPKLVDSHVSRVAKWIGFAVSSGDNLTGLPDANTRLPAEFQVDWVRVAAYDPAAAPSPTPAPPPAPGPTPTTAPPQATASAARADAAARTRPGSSLGLGWWLTIAAGLGVAGAAGVVAVRRQRPRGRHRSDD